MRTAKEGVATSSGVVAGDISGFQSPRLHLTFNFFLELGNNHGVIPRAIKHIFNTIEDLKQSSQLKVEVNLKASFLEIYRENVRDL